MLTVSKSLSAGQARMYHSRECTSEKQNYWSRDQQAHNEWRGKLAQEWGLDGEVGSEHFARLSEGQHPESGLQLVKHQPARTYENEYGKEITRVEHRAGWDATFSAPKSVSLTALVGRDDRVREAHRESVRVALGELERYTQARIGNVHAPEATGKFIATFEHDNLVIFNVTERENGQARALQERSLFQSQPYATSVYRSELAMRLHGLGYEIQRGKHGQPEIKGYTREYLDASSPRREQSREHLQAIGRGGAGAAQVAAHRTRDSKELLSPRAVRERLSGETISVLSGALAYSPLPHGLDGHEERISAIAREQQNRHRVWTWLFCALLFWLHQFACTVPTQPKIGMLCAIKTM